jgi:hypothetical protein
MDRQMAECVESSFESKVRKSSYVDSYCSVFPILNLSKLYYPS